MLENSSSVMERRRMCNKNNYLLKSSLTDKLLQLSGAPSFPPWRDRHSFIMSACCRHVLGLLLSIIGFLGTIFICALPLWKVSAFVGSSITTSQIDFVGLWVTCVMRSTGKMQCKSYNSIQDLPKDLQGARVLIVFAIIIQFFGIVLGVVGAKCTNFIPDARRKTKADIASGVLFLIAASLVALPVHWTTRTIVNDMFNPDLPSDQRRDLGASLFIGLVSAGLLYLGGALLCCSYFCRIETECDVKSAHTNTKQQRSSRQRSTRNKKKISWWFHSLFDWVHC